MAKKVVEKEKKAAAETKRIGLRELAETVAERHADISKAEITNIVRDTIDTIHNSLAKKKSVVLTGTFALEPVLRPERIGRNPQKPDEPVTIPEHWAVRLKLGKSLKNDLN